MQFNRHIEPCLFHIIITNRYCSYDLSLSLSLSLSLFFQAFIQLFSSIPQPPDTLVVEYFLDKERAHLFFNETKPLTVSQYISSICCHTLPTCSLFTAAVCTYVPRTLILLSVCTCPVHRICMPHTCSTLNFVPVYM